MQVICSWCEIFIKEKSPFGDKSISHSICEECYKKVINEVVGKYKKSEGRLKHGGSKVGSTFNGEG